MKQHPQNILFIIDHLKGGGAERILIDVASGLQLKNHNITIALLDDTNIKMTIPKELTIIPLKFDNNFMKGDLWLDTVNKLTIAETNKIQNLISCIKPDIIFLSHWFAFQTYPALHGNIWYWIHNEIFDCTRRQTTNIFRWYKEYRRYNKQKLKFQLHLNNKNLICVDSELEKKYRLLLPKARICVIPNGIDKKKIGKLSDAYSSKNWDCIFVGRLSHEKQPEHAIKAFALSKLSGRLAIVGDGDMLNDLKKLTLTLGIHNRVDFLGWQTNPYLFISQSKSLILCSKTEGFGLVVAEALTLKTPVIAYAVSNGVIRQLEKGELSQGIVEAQNIIQLAEKIKLIVSQPYVINECDIAHLSIEHTINKFIELL